jgi:hypothetical protein
MVSMRESEMRESESDALNAALQSADIGVNARDSVTAGGP